MTQGSFADNIIFASIRTRAWKGGIMRVGYQGVPGSNSERAARIMIPSACPAGATLVPLVGSPQVVNALIAGTIDYGVLAVRNSIGGAVRETAEILATVGSGAAITMSTVVLDIRHNLYKLPGVPDGRLRRVASHEQALRQTRRTRTERWPDLTETPVADTAIAARWLADSRLPSDVAVICGEDAGTAHGLELMAADIQDGKSQTEFHMVAIASDILDTEA